MVSVSYTLTVKFHKVVGERLSEVAPGSLPLRQSSLSCFPVHEHHHAHGRQTASYKDNSKRAKCPSKAGTLIESSSNLWSSKGRDDTRSTVDSEDDHAVLQGGHVGTHDVDHVDDTDVAGPVQDMSRDVGLDVLADGLHDNTHHSQDEHEDEALNTSPDIDDLCGCERNASSQGGGHDVANSKQSMATERRGNVGIQRRVDVVLEHVHEVDEPQPGNDQYTALNKGLRTLTGQTC